MEEKMKARKFKVECLEVIERVKRTKKKVVITKRNIPIAKIVPIEEQEAKIFGRFQGTIRFLGDIVNPINATWIKKKRTCH